MVKNRIILIVTLLLGIWLGIFLNRVGFLKEKEVPVVSTKHMRANGNLLCKPLLRVETSQSKDPRLLSTKYSIQKYIDSCIENKEASRISVYLMDLYDNSWMGIGEQDSYSLASLIKIPVMMIYLKQAEKNADILNKTIKYDVKADVLPQNLLSQQTIETGKAYSIKELLSYMIINSDNVAMTLLMANMDEALINELCTDLQLLTLVTSGKEHKISTKDIAGLLQTLYEATYLNKDLSNNALELLSQTNFNDGLVAGIPQGITVSHKFAERAYSPGNEKQLHDCGIVFLEKRPYLICVMTAGWDFDTLKGVIKRISKIAYNHMSQDLVTY